MSRPDRPTPRDPLPAFKPTPGYPRTHAPRPGGRKPADTLKNPVPPPGPGNRRPSPPPVEEPVDSAELGRKVVELGDTKENLETERQLRHEAEAEARRLRAELRSARSENASARHVEPAPRVEAEAIVITRRGLSFPWAMAPWVIAALAGGWAAKTHVDRGAPAAKDVTATAAVAAKTAGDATASASATATEVAAVKAECRETIAHVINVIEALRPGLKVTRPANIPAGPELIVEASKEDAKAPLKLGGPITIKPKNP